MNLDAVLTLVSFVSFVALLATWIVAPLRADAPESLAIRDVAPPAPVAV